MHRRLLPPSTPSGQDLAAGLGGDFILAACRAGGPHLAGRLPRNSGGRRSLVPRSDLPRQHHLDPRLVVRSSRRFTACPPSVGACRTSRWSSIGRSPRDGQGPDSCRRDGRTLARPSRAFLEDGSRSPGARYPRAAAQLRPARWTGRRLRLPDSPHAGVFHAGTGLLLEVIAAPLRLLMTWPSILGILPLLIAGDVFVADRGFCSFAHLALLMTKGASCGVSPSPEAVVDFTRGVAPCPAAARSTRGDPHSRWVSACGLMDQVVEYFKPAQRPKWMSEDDMGVAGVDHRA